MRVKNRVIKIMHMLTKSVLFSDRTVLIHGGMVKDRKVGFVVMLNHQNLGRIAVIE